MGNSDDEGSGTETFSDRMARESKPLAVSTAEFLGDVRTATLQLERSTTYGLGGVSILVTGAGEVTIDKSAFSLQEQACTHRFLLPASDAESVFAALVEADFGRLDIPQRPGYPDMVWISLALTNQAGRTRRLGTFFLSDAPVFERLVLLIRTTVGRRVDDETKRRLTI